MSKVYRMPVVNLHKSFALVNTKSRKEVLTSLQFNMFSLHAYMQEGPRFWDGTTRQQTRRSPLARADAPRYLGDLPHAGCRPGHFLIPAANFPPWGAVLSDGNRGIKNDIGIHLHRKEKDVLLIQDLNYERLQHTYWRWMTHARVSGFLREVVFKIQHSVSFN